MTQGHGNISVQTETKELLKEIKLVPEESYNSVIKRLIKEHNEGVLCLEK